ncbi:hypothetical protein KP509_02G091100 [Ceratopteris richardii]|uniref:Uncharacterized protein n=1 Tax=Ceratopteris richardii TaxID=49495 RepID=A0A8T2V8K7_CERRI|nr:hypothetical protein KP509_1Z317400 [Ceratopteris richardii]KAH7444777.1 hypothetical protein KP509_02G091100 [Ceratopteris richardii]
MGAPGVAVAPCPAGIVCIPAKISSRYGSRSSYAIRCSEGSSGFASSPKTGAVGGQRLENALPGTYWGKDNGVGNEIQVIFNKGSDVVMTKARVGENLLRVAERCGVMLPTPVRLS